MTSLQPSITTQSSSLPVPPPATSGSTPKVSITNADAYFATTPRDAEWTAITDKQIWLNEAYRWLGQLCMDQTKQCCGLSFVDAWTAANSELALALSKSPTSIIGGGPSAPTGGTKRQKLGDLEVEFFQASNSSPDTIRYGVNDPLVLQKYPWIGELLSCYLTGTRTSGSRVIARVRS